ncbi:ATP-binding protein [Aureivirga marina]|uniref:ATP-binding protein n=1 Tax=Aureivirga marina TaxID=1182451 RepID=UPI0018CBE531|nr:hypothetical protein [Aureivirga marina]
MKKKLLLISTIIILFFPKYFFAQYSENDSIQKWFKIVRDSDRCIDERESFLQKINEKVQENNHLFKKYNSHILGWSLKLKDSSIFYQNFKRMFELNSIKKDTNRIATLYRLGAKASDVFFNFDSAYSYLNKAARNYRYLNKKEISYTLMTKMAREKMRMGDYVKAENIYIEILREKDEKLIEGLKFDIYCELIKINVKHGNYLKAFDNIDQLQKTVDTKKDNFETKKYTYSYFYYIIGSIYRQQKDYKNALEYFQKSVDNLYDEKLKVALLNKNYEEIDCKFYAFYLDQLSFLKMKNGDKSPEILKNFHLSTEIIDFYGKYWEWDTYLEERNKYLLHIGEYHFLNKNNDLAYNFIKQALDLARKTKRIEDNLYALKLLSKIDISKKDIYLAEYLQLKQKISAFEKHHSERFVADQFRTEELRNRAILLESRQEQLTNQNRTISFYLAFIFALFILYLIYTQKIRNKKLMLQNEKQEMNLQLFALTIKLYQKLGEEKKQEKQRIASELHDGVLSRFFGLRLLMNFTNVNLNEEDYKKYKSIIEDLYKIEMKARNISHELSFEADDDINPEDIYEDLLFDALNTYFENCKLEMISGVEWHKLSLQFKANIFVFLKEINRLIFEKTQPSKISLEIQTQEKKLIFIIKDNGTCFTKKDYELKKVKFHISKLGGKISIESKINIGKTIIIELPIPTKK